MDELDRILKSAEPPGRTDEHWEAFPKEVVARLRREEDRAGVLEPAAGRKFGVLFGWGMGFATACVLVAVVLGLRGRHSPTTKPNELAEAKKCYAEISALFPNQVRAIVFDQQGMRLELSDKADVPESTPYYVKICGAKGCQSYVTFSGQQIQFEGERCEVLADARNRVLLVSNLGVWSAGGKSGGIRVEAQPLNAAL